MKDLLIADCFLYEGAAMLEMIATSRTRICHIENC